MLACFLSDARLRPEEGEKKRPRGVASKASRPEEKEKKGEKHITLVIGSDRGGKKGNQPFAFLFRSDKGKKKKRGGKEKFSRTRPYGHLLSPERGGGGGEQESIRLLRGSKGKKKRRDDWGGSNLAFFSFAVISAAGEGGERAEVPSRAFRASRKKKEKKRGGGEENGKRSVIGAAYLARSWEGSLEKRKKKEVKRGDHPALVQQP